MEKNGGETAGKEWWLNTRWKIKKSGNISVGVPKFLATSGIYEDYFCTTKLYLKNHFEFLDRFEKVVPFFIEVI